MLVMRKVAMAASAGFVKANDFKDFWPLPERFEEKNDIPSWASTPKEMRKEILRKHGIIK